MTTREERQHTITDFLSRPIIVQTGLWSSTDITETQLYTANFPEVLIANAMYQEKLRGFVGLRATLVIKVQVNSQPFQQGRLMLQYYPYAQYMPNRVDLVNSTLQGRSGCPRTDLDLSVGTEVEMRIPYVSPHVYYNLITGQGSFGAIYLVVYSQLRDQISGTGSVEYTVWAHLEDVDVQYPTGANIFTGSAPNYLSIAQHIATGNFTDKDMQKLYKNQTYKKKPSKIFAQGGLELKQLKDNASPSAGIGQISEGLSTLSRIPILGNMFTKPAWISAAASNIFKMLGYSKPTIQGLPCETKLRAQARMANYDGADCSHKMALSSSNEIETSAGLAGTSADEMDFSHILSIPNFWDRFTWSTDAATNSVLWDNLVTPFKVKTYSDTILDRFRCTHMGYVANSHTYWRGSIVYTFKFVKTQFHSGRLRISFIPFYYNTDISTGTPDISKTQKIIIDLRTSTEVSFTVPYISSRPWMYCIRPESSWLGTNDELMYNAVTGIVRVEVLNQLVAANNVFQSIDVIAEVNGGPDLTFAGPTAPSYIPYSGDFTAAATEIKQQQHYQEYDNRIRRKRELDDIEEDKIVAQVMGENEAIPRNEAQHGIHPTPIDTHKISANWSPEAFCIGEKIMSVRQLIKRFGLVSSIPISDPATANGIIIAPFSVREPVAVAGGNRTMSMFEYYYFLYGFWRGSMRLKATSVLRTGTITDTRGFDGYYVANLLTSVQDAFNNIVSRFSPGTITQNAQIDDNGIYTMGSSVQIIKPSLEGMVEVEVPYYNVSHISPATVYAEDEAPISIPNVLKGHIPPSVLTLGITDVNSYVQSPTQDLSMTFFRAPGDDFSFMYLVGVPPLVNVARV